MIVADFRIYKNQTFILENQSLILRLHRHNKNFIIQGKDVCTVIQ